ncbi:uncharacterized protein N7482_009381 [Penicillium canariense]|uniref:Uncharacterized protein n=1 Tax=Penicillium canariense TaxID=189055 RepID=A0A9W9LFS3_9EURO|nr:uncharacterized protein N7482_009381 [Penicillium canariense]KAJ5152903.1 hypothetical protein N7482_009381 [Penicillium canariense]
MPLLMRAARIWRQWSSRPGALSGEPGRFGVLAHGRTIDCAGKFLLALLVCWREIRDQCPSEQNITWQRPPGSGSQQKV